MEKQVDPKQLIQDAIKGLQAGKKWSGAKEALTPLIKHIVEASLEGEREAHLDFPEEAGTRKNMCLRLLVPDC